MNHNATLAIVAVVTAMTLTAVAFAIPQQALAYRHHNNHNNNNNHKNSIKVDQQVNQQNSCTGVPVVLEPGSAPLDATSNMPTSSDSVSGSVCLNSGDNSVDIHK